MNSSNIFLDPNKRTSELAEMYPDFVYVHQFNLETCLKIVEPVMIDLIASGRHRSSGEQFACWVQAIDIALEQFHEAANILSIQGYRCSHYSNDDGGIDIVFVFSNPTHSPIFKMAASGLPGRAITLASWLDPN